MRRTALRRMALRRARTGGRACRVAFCGIDGSGRLPLAVGRTMDELSLAALALYTAIIAFAGLVHGTLGMGFPVVATPLLSLMTDVRSAILITLLPTVAVNVGSILRGGDWSRSIGRFWPLALYGLAGSVAGANALVVLDPAPFKLLLAGLVLLYLWASRARGPRMPWVAAHLPLSMAAFGLAAGLAAGTTNVMVPILIIYALELGLARTAMVQVFNLCFLAGKLAQIGVFAAAGLLTGALLLATAPLAVVATVALAAGMHIRDRVPASAWMRAVRGLLLVLAVLLVGQFLIQDRAWP